jgi:SAM-dependent methyltransferase
LDTASATYPRPPVSAPGDIATRLRKLGWVVRNFATDLRYGRVLAGDIKTRYRSAGAHNVVNSQYSVLPHIFADRIGDDDVLVDVGCGKGRVINCWLSCGLRNRIVGIELDPEVAATTRKRLRRFRNVDIVNADATRAVPDDATLLYMYSPFDRGAMRRLKGDLERRFQRRGITALYWNPEYVDVFRDDPRWATNMIGLDDVDDPRIGGSHARFAVVELRPG